MPDVIGLIAVLGAFSVGPAVIYLRSKAKLAEKRLEPEGGKPVDTEEVKQLTSDNKLLRERVENLESIVCSVDFELNQKLAKVIDEQRSMIPPAAPPGG